MVFSMRRFRDALRSKDESAKLADIALRDEIAAFDLVSSLGSADEEVRLTASKAIAEVARRDYDKLLGIILRWSSERHYKLNQFLKWTDGIESKNLDKLRKVVLDRVKSATAVDQIVNQYDSVNEKIDRLREFLAQKRVTQQAFEKLKKEYEDQLAEATKKLLTQVLTDSQELEELSQMRAKIKDDLSVLETRATLGDIGRKESESLRAESKIRIEAIQQQDKKLTEELTVMLMSAGPVKIHDENGKMVAVASEFVVDRDHHVVDLRARMLSESDVQALQMMDNRAALVTLIYNLTSRSPQDPVLTSDRLTPEIIDKVSDVVATELKVSSEEALHTDKLRYFLEMTSWKSPKAKIIMVPTQALTPSEKGFIVKRGAIQVEEPKPSEPEKVAKVKPEEIIAPPQPRAMEEKPVQKPPEIAREVKPPPAPAVKKEPQTEVGSPPEKQASIEDNELQQEVENLKAMLDEDEAASKSKKEKPIENVGDRVLTEIDKAAEKLRQRMKSR
jgi:hypothetical protein